MEVIEIQHPHHFQQDAMPQAVMALGYFDGVHLGHQEVIKMAKKIADEKGIKSAVMTFDPHPSVVLGKNVQHVDMITPLQQKIEIIEQLGIDRLYLVHFDLAFASLLPQEFVDQYIIGLHIKHVVAGFDYSYGKMGKGTMETLPFHSRNQFTQTIIDKLTLGEEKISSTFIRKCLKEGNVDALSDLLGREYSIKGHVVHGDKRGRQIGFPTANVESDDAYLIPSTGVYAVEAHVLGQWYQGVCNVGYKPTFNKESDGKPTIEVHLFQFDEQVYDQPMEVRFYQKLRGEQKFNGIESLVAQIEKDKQEAIRYFNKK
ncbi:bifunctional riboflavin kinase/FAD synthetase [Priestia koreensis]|uniref:Riboflavin biosynthesis protein n=1 Tax=Priestia koreensis TaxID=284581 RepID=A0A0M0L6T5_9BACI|nr:bifunctional riboflavin kinase/FAD synthetase [Priestia koreensis]KOO46572.1 riboflavin biosynthesis protein RibF [Priestia koreensis]